MRLTPSMQDALRRVAEPSSRYFIARPGDLDASVFTGLVRSGHLEVVRSVEDGCLLQLTDLGVDALHRQTPDR